MLTQIQTKQSNLLTFKTEPIDQFWRVQFWWKWQRHQQLFLWEREQENFWSFDEERKAEFEKKKSQSSESPHKKSSTYEWGGAWSNLLLSFALQFQFVCNLRFRLSR